VPAAAVAAAIEDQADTVVIDRLEIKFSSRWESRSPTKRRLDTPLVDAVFDDWHSSCDLDTPLNQS
jgi:hypothetical protein